MGGPAWGVALYVMEFSVAPYCQRFLGWGYA